jgi:CheY-like chemotaxis protein
MPHTVLIVEDEVELRELMQVALERKGYEVIAVSDGRAALDAIPSIERLCLVLLDLLMPGMNGWEFVAQARTQPQLAEVPIIVHSSATNEAPAGATAVLRKPIKLERLLSVVGQYCEPATAI